MRSEHFLSRIWRSLIQLSMLEAQNDAINSKRVRDACKCVVLPAYVPPYALMIIRTSLSFVRQAKGVSLMYWQSGLMPWRMCYSRFWSSLHIYLSPIWLFSSLFLSQTFPNLNDNQGGENKLKNTNENARRRSKELIQVKITTTMWHHPLQSISLTNTRHVLHKSCYFF